MRRTLGRWSRERGSRTSVIAFAFGLIIVFLALAAQCELSRQAQLMRAGAKAGGVWAWGSQGLMGVDRLAGNDLSP